MQTAANFALLECKILRRRPDLIHLNSAFDTRSVLRDAPLAFVAGRHGIPLLLKVHGSLSETIRPTRNAVEFAKRIVIGNLSLLCVLSAAEKAEFERFHPELQGRVCVVKNVISEAVLNVERRESHLPLVLFVSRFVRRKGPFHLLDAIPAILEGIPKAQFVFVGDGPDAAAFDLEIRKRRLASVVQRFPHVSHDEIAAWYTRAWVLVFPTLFPEGMPMVVAEAMATGTPIVASRTRFCRSYMVEHENCLYCEPENPGSIAQQVITLLADSGMRQKMSQSNRMLAQQFRKDAVACEFMGLYERLCSAVPRSSTAFSTAGQS